MKVYTLLKSEKGLSKIITWPERPDSDMELIFDNVDEKSIIRNKEIWSFVNLNINTFIGKDLAMAIVCDYPHLFKEPLDFSKSCPIPSLDQMMFSHLSEDLKSFAENRLKKLNEQISRSPNDLKFKIERADLLCNAGEYQRAKIEYNALILSAENDYFKSKIKHGLSECESKIKESLTIFQTPFVITTDLPHSFVDGYHIVIENKETGFSKNNNVFFLPQSPDVTPEQSNNISWLENFSMDVD